MKHFLIYESIHKEDLELQSSLEFLPVTTMSFLTLITCLPSPPPTLMIIVHWYLTGWETCCVFLEWRQDPTHIALQPFYLRSVRCAMKGLYIRTRYGKRTSELFHVMLTSNFIGFTGLRNQLELQANAVWEVVFPVCQVKESAAWNYK